MNKPFLGNRCVLSKLPAPYFIVIFFLLITINSSAQNTLRVLVRTEGKIQPLVNASVLIPQLNKGTSTDSTGTAVISGLPDGKFIVEVSYIGYTTSRRSIFLPGTVEIEVVLEEA